MNSYDPLGRSTELTETDEQLLNALDQPLEKSPAEVSQRAKETTPVLTPPPTTEATEGAAPAAPANTQQPAVKEEEEGSNPLEALDDFLENSAVEVRDWIDDKLQGNQQSKEEIRSSREEARQEKIDEVNNLEGAAKVTSEVVRAAVSGREKQISELVGGVSYVGDLLKTKVGLADEDDQWNNVDHANYSSLDYNLQAAQPTTGVGIFARDAVAFIQATRSVGALPGLAQGTKAANALTNPAARFTAQRAMEGLVGGVTDFMMDPGDANASNMIMSYIPGADAGFLASLAGDGAAFLRDGPTGFVFEKLAQDDDDNEFTRRLKNSAEGSVIQQGVDAVGLLGIALKRAVVPGLKWLKSHPGKTSADIPAEIKAEQQAIFTEQLSLGLLDDVPTKPTKTLAAEDVYDEVVNNGDYSRLNELSPEELKRITDKEGYDALAFVDDEDAAINSIDVDTQMEVFGKAITVKKLPNGSKIKWKQRDISEEFAPQSSARLRQRAEAIQEMTEAGLDTSDASIETFLTNNYDAPRVDGPLTGQKVVRIDWDIEGENLGTGGTRLYRQFGEVAKEQKPGTIIQAEAANDGYGAKGMSYAQAKAAEKAAGPISGRMDPADAAEINRLAKERYDGIYGEGEWAQLDREGRSIHIDDMRADEPDFARLFDEASQVQQAQSIREKLYKRAGLSEPNGEGKMYGIVKYKPDGRKSMQPLDPTKPIQEQVDEAMDSAKQFELGIDFDSAEVRPGKFDRLKEDYENGGSRFQAEFEPFERAGKSAEFDIVDVARQQDYHANGPTQGLGAPSPHMTDNTIRQLNEAGMAGDLINATAEKAASSLRQRLLSSNPEIRNEALEQIRKWHRQNPVDGQNFSTNNEALLEVKENAYGVKESYIRTLAGNNVAKVLITDIAQQITEIGGSAAEIAQSGMTPNRQLNMLMDRLNSMTILQIEDASNRGGVLQGLKGKLGFGTSPDTVKTKIKEATDKVEDLRKQINEGDVKAVEDVMVLAEAMKLADGRPDIALKFKDKFFSYSREMFEVTMYNSYLSGLVTQERNILGNGFNVFMKPLDILMGSHGKLSEYDGAIRPEDVLANSNRRKSALAMYSSMMNSYSEGYKIFKLALKENNADIMSKTMSTAGENMRAKIDNLIAEAERSGDFGKVFAARWGLGVQYYTGAHPWLQQATRVLDATDKGFRVVSARQKAHYDMMMNVLDDFDGDATKFSAEKLEIDLKSKIKENGDIVDQQLLDWAKEDTFQEELGWRMQGFQNMLNDNPILKYSVPFVKTPTNILRRTGQYTPFVNRFLNEYDAVMKGTDETKKAIYRGREAQGQAMALTFTTMGFFGVTTGAGPQDPNLRKTWEENNEPHSFKVGGVWVSNRFLGPIGILMSLYADLGMYGANRGSYDGFADAGSQLAYTIAGGLFEQSWAKGVFALMDVLDDIRSGKAVDAEAAVAQLMRARIPYQAAFRGFNNALIPGLREYDNVWQKLLAETIPGTKAFLGAERTSPFTGKPVANQGLSAINQMSPFGLDEIRNDKAVGYLVQYGVSVPYKFMDEYKDIKLTGADHKTLNQYMASGGMDGKGVRGALIEYFEGRPFEAAYQEWVNMKHPVEREKAQWYRVAKRIWAEHRKAAVDKYMNNATPAGDAFKEKVSAVDLRDHFMKIGLYDEASIFQQQIENF